MCTGMAKSFVFIYFDQMTNRHCERNLSRVFNISLPFRFDFFFAGSVDLNFATQLYKDLKKAEESLVLTSHLHLLFLVTPYDLVRDVQPPWMTYFKQVNR
jgi:hypothetical protein